jgi:hypothetical protein
VRGFGSFATPAVICVLTTCREPDRSIGVMGAGRVCLPAPSNASESIIDWFAIWVLEELWRLLRWLQVR